jgi:hypothetical protein
VFSIKQALRRADLEVPVPADEIEEDIKSSLESMTEPEEVVAFVSALGRYNENRAHTYLRAIKAGASPIENLWDSIKRQAEAPETTTTEGEEVEEPIEEVAAAEDTDVGVPVVNPEVLEAENPEIAMALFQAEGDDPRWAVFANGRPLAEIALSAQENSVAIRDAFVSDAYRNILLASFGSSMRAKDILASVNARYYQAVTQQSEIQEQARSAATRQLEDEYATRLAALRENLLNTINLAVAASLKGTNGLFVKNGLRTAMVEAMRAAGVQSAGPIVRAAFAKSATGYFADILKQAEKWLSYAPESLSEVRAEVLGSDGAEEDDEAEETAEVMPPDMDPTVAARAASLARRATPVRTPHVAYTPTEDTADDRKRTVVASLVRKATGG